MIERSGKLPVKRQCELFGLNRTGVYYQPRPVSRGTSLTGEKDVIRTTESRCGTGNPS